MSGLLPFSFKQAPLASAKPAVDKDIITDDFDSYWGESDLTSGLSPIDERMLMANVQQLRLRAVFVMKSLMQWEESEDQEANVSPSELLDGLLLDAVGLDDNDEDSSDSVGQLTAHIKDFMDSMGVSVHTVNQMFSDNTAVADAAIQTVINQLKADGFDDDWLNQFIYGFDMSDIIFDDDDQYDAAGGEPRYKAVKAIRNGQVVKVNKRISGKVKLSAKQKAALKKAQAKAHTGSANKERLKSFLLGVKKGIYKHIGKGKSAGGGGSGGKEDNRSGDDKKTPAQKQAKAAQKRLDKAGKGAYHPSKYIPMATDSEEVKQALHKAGQQIDKRLKQASKGPYHPSKYIPMGDEPEHVKNALHSVGQEIKDRLDEANNEPYHPANYIPMADDPDYVKKALQEEGERRKKQQR